MWLIVDLLSQMNGFEQKRAQFSFCIRKLLPGSKSFKGNQSQYVVFSDVEERVAEKQNFSANAVCSNVNGSYTCGCKTGCSGKGWSAKVMR